MPETSAAQINAPRLNHAVLYVRELERSVDFYKRAFGFEEIARESGMMAFLRAAGSANHHDLGLMQVGVNAEQPAGRAVRLYHLAWEVLAIGEPSRRIEADIPPQYVPFRSPKGLFHAGDRGRAIDADNAQIEDPPRHRHRRRRELRRVSHARSRADARRRHRSV